MKKIVLFVAAALLVGTALISCKDKKAPADTKPVETSMFTKEDTTKVMDLVNQFTVCLQNGDIKGALDMLVMLDGDSIKPIDPANLQRQANSLRFIAGMPGYELDRIVMQDEKRNEAKIDIVLFEKKDENDKRPNTTSFYLRPVYINGQWYLTTRDNITSTVDENPEKQEIKNLGEVDVEGE